MFTKTKLLCENAPFLKKRKKVKIDKNTLNLGCR